MNNWVVFSSSSGQTFNKVWRALKPETQAGFQALFVDRKCGMLDVAKDFLPENKIYDFSTSTSKEDFERSYLTWADTQKEKPLIILIGYFRLISKDFLSKSGSALINTHPSLLPAFPGLDMKVHEAAFQRSIVSGFTVHLVNENMDDGPIIFQKAVSTADCKSPEELRNKVRDTEQKYLPQVIDQIVKIKLTGVDRQLVTRELQNKEGFPLICVD